MSRQILRRRLLSFIQFPSTRLNSFLQTCKSHCVFCRFTDLRLESSAISYYWSLILKDSLYIIDADYSSLLLFYSLSSLFQSCSLLILSDANISCSLQVIIYLSFYSNCNMVSVCFFLSDCIYVEAFSSLARSLTIVYFKDLSSCSF